MKLPGIQRIGALTAESDLSGGIKLVLGDRSCVIPKDEAIRYASVILRLAGCNVDFHGGSEALQRFVRPQ